MIVRDEAFQRRQIQGIVHSGARTRGGTGMCADPSTYGGEWVIAQNDLERLVKALLRDQGHVPLSALMNRACSLAGSGPAARDREDVRDSLWEGTVDCLSLSQPLIELGRQRDWTLCRASAAARAFRRDHKAWLLLNPDREISRYPIDVFHLTQGKDFDVLVPADLDQARRHGAHRAIVGGKSFVELRHDPANGSAALGQIHLDATVGQIESGLHAADTASYDQGSTHGRGLGTVRRHGGPPPLPALAARLSS